MKSIRKPILSLLFVILLSLTLLWGCGTPTVSFQDYMDDFFVQQVSGNTIDLNFFLEDPKAYGIENHIVSLGDYSKEARRNTGKSLRMLMIDISRYEDTPLTTSEQLTYDVLMDYLQLAWELSEYDLYDEVLTPHNGIHTQLPILLSEFDFDSEQDIRDYLQLLSITHDYYKQLIAFEKEKAKKGLFMSDTSCLAFIESCEDFLDTKENGFLSTTFVSRIEETDFLTEEQKDSYIQRNEKNLKEEFYPAYEYLMEEMSDLMGSGTNDWGLCYFPEGKEYYELLVQLKTGSRDSIETIYEKIESRRQEALTNCALVMQQDAEVLNKAYTMEWTLNDPSEILEHLKTAMRSDFPEGPDTTYTISYVDKALEDVLSPAFYITAPIDNYYENDIYINNGSIQQDIYYFTTLAHEGYPGHLYQTTYSYDAGLHPVRSLFSCTGYVEGWATYVEYLSFSYTNIDENVATFLSNNDAATLSLYATTDIGIHHYGWTQEDVLHFWNSYGIDNEDAILEITDYIITEPGTYLQYYVGYIQFLDLLDYAQELEGETFSLIEFHRTLLEIGPAPFYIVQEYYPEYRN